MGDALRRRLKQSKFESAHHEAILGLLVAAAYIDEGYDRLCDDFGISRQQFNILRILKGAGPDGHPCGEVAVRMLDRSPDVTRRIDGLVKLGYVERTRSEEDRRVVIARITDAGRALLEVIAPKEREFMAGVKRKLTARECQDIVALSEKLFAEDD